MKDKIQEKVLKAMPMFVGTLIIVIGIHFFMIPNHFIPGSISGFALVLTKFVPVPVSVVTLILNMICLALGFMF